MKTYVLIMFLLVANSCFSAELSHELAKNLGVEIIETPLEKEDNAECQLMDIKLPKFLKEKPEDSKVEVVLKMFNKNNQKLAFFNRVHVDENDSSKYLTSRFCAPIEDYKVELAIQYKPKKGITLCYTELVIRGLNNWLKEL